MTRRLTRAKKDPWQLPRGGLPVRLARGRKKGSIAWLVSWLNAGQRLHAVKSVKDRTRIVVLIERLQVLSRASAKLHALSREQALSREKLSPQQVEYEFYRRRDEMDEAWVAVNVITWDRYDILQGFCPTAGGPNIDVVDERRGFLSDDEYFAYLTIRELVRCRSFDRLTRCDQCRAKWIFRRRKNQRYCSEKCRQNRYETSPQRREQRREYMREYQRNLRKAQKHGKR